MQLSGKDGMLFAFSLSTGFVIIIISINITVASVIDRGSRVSPAHAFNISGQEVGYVVSHSGYDFYNTYANYRFNTNSSLTLTGITSNVIEIIFEKFELETSPSCRDYLLITTLEKICQRPDDDLVVYLNGETTEITFNFVTNAYPSKNGFWLQYKRKC